MSETPVTYGMTQRVEALERQQIVQKARLTIRDSQAL
jgi:hypothetical protein